MSKVPPVNQQECLINRAFHTFNVMSNYFGPMTPEKLSFEKLEKQVIKCKKVFL